MKTISRSLAVAGVLAIGSLALGASPARAQAFGFSYASPGLSVGVGTGAFPGYYPAPYPLVAPAPVVVPAAPVIVPRPVLVPRPYYFPGYYGAFRPDPRYYRR
jgi:hypothetical protein